MPKTARASSPYGNEARCRTLTAKRLCRSLDFLFEQFTDDLVDHLVSEGADFFWCFRLNRVLHQNRFVLRHAKRCALSAGGSDELSSGNVRGGNVFFFEINHIVRTARDASSSIAEGFDDGVAFLRQLSPDWFRSGTRDRRFHPTQYFLYPVLLA